MEVREESDGAIEQASKWETHKKQIPLNFHLNTLVIETLLPNDLSGSQLSFLVS